jgi:putative endonuclease
MRRVPVERAAAYTLVMAGLDPAISEPAAAAEAGATGSDMGGRVYIVTNRPDGTLYVGVTGDLARRAWEHREGAVDGFTKKYRLKRLVWAERHEDIRTAIQREKNIKHWPRAWKVDLIIAQNPDWADLYQHPL